MLIPGGNSPSPLSIQNSKLLPSGKSTSVATNWKSIISLSKIKNLLLIGELPTDNLPSLVFHKGSSGPLTTILNVLSSITLLTVARNTKVNVLSRSTCFGVPIMLFWNILRPGGNEPAIIDIVGLIPEVRGNPTEIVSSSLVVNKVVPDACVQLDIL